MKVQAEKENKPDNERCRELWRAFGLESDVGKRLYQMYNKGGKANPVAYPPTRPRKKAESVKPRKPCPQMTVIEYPNPNEGREVFSPAPIFFVPRRKRREQIVEEAEKARKEETRFVPPPGKDRQKMVVDLQRKLRGLDAVDSQLRAKALSACSRRVALLEARLNDKGGQTAPADPVKELSALFDQIAQEVEEDQVELLGLESRGLNELAERKKMAMAAKVADLQRIIRLINAKRSAVA